MKIFDGRKESKKILEKLKIKIKKKNLKPHMAVFLIGDNKASEMYVDLKARRAKEIGVKFSRYTYGKNADENEVIQKIGELNEDAGVNGMIVQMPLPAGFNTEKIISSMSPAKDIDGFHKKNTDVLKNAGKIKVSPVLPGVILYALKTAWKGKPKKGKIKALVNSRLFGDTLKEFFSAHGIPLEFFVAKNVSVKKIREFVKDADVLISVLGKKGIITGDMLKRDVILIDVGITKEHNNVYGDFEFESCAKKASFITPVPGGIGPMTIALLLQNVVSLTSQGIEV
ncbi:MAG TPA: bifunctional 5,10-methylenetetrahydrofolate dehydrogenase/5,10-methenyltetrahydrofolate cyclohydrolase [Candidatus Kaiserbacteria bacterium]|nr:bifunctional 5,10-methylenetetrahydrofolate dehydrogenase/5,10-methenyltetrahydrofolate cyclohydrolase [Candidatus Kaiserbacteria bacterium]